MAPRVKRENKNICIDCKGRIDALSTQFSLSPEENILLDQPKRVFTFSIPLKRDDGSVEINERDFPRDDSEPRFKNKVEESIYRAKKKIY